MSTILQDGGQNTIETSHNLDYTKKSAPNVARENNHPASLWVIQRIYHTSTNITQAKCYKQQTMQLSLHIPQMISCAYTGSPFWLVSNWARDRHTANDNSINPKEDNCIGGPSDVSLRVARSQDWLESGEKVECVSQVSHTKTKVPYLGRSIVGRRY